MSEEQKNQQIQINSIIEKEIRKDENNNKIIDKKDININGIDAIHEDYYWNGYSAESIILPVNMVVNYSENELKDILFQNNFCEKNTEILFEYDSHNVFMNFNFKKPNFDAF